MTDFSGDRRDFFRRAFGDAVRQVGKLTEERIVRQRYVRPPGAIPEIAFLAACTRCGECAPVCPAGAIMHVPNRGGLAAGTPYLEPSRIPCIACDTMPCAAACPTDALIVPEAGWTTERLGRIEFHPDRCVTFEGKPCRVCVEACPVGEAALSSDADGHPVLKLDGCVACGVCVRDCITLPSSFSFHPVDR
ncbi:MAG TPA: 4Fe-4S dicluster domain-containing protein [Gemmatimonadales bacterium]|nr:4Fe-4S dicluster domain-containing protein [Gemmatimonadales bacterium]